MGFLHMKFRAGLVAFGALIFVAGCAEVARQEDDALVKAGFTKTKVPPGASLAKSILFLHFVHRPGRRRSYGLLFRSDRL